LRPPVAEAHHGRDRDPAYGRRSLSRFLQRLRQPRRSLSRRRRPRECDRELRALARAQSAEHQRDRSAAPPRSAIIQASMRRDLEIIAAVAESLNSAATVQEALERTLEVIDRELKLDTGWVWLVDPDTGHV